MRLRKNFRKRISLYYLFICPPKSASALFFSIILFSLGGHFIVSMRSSKGRPPKQLPKQVEEDLLAEVQRLRAENDYLKNLQALVLEDERRQRRKRR